MLYTSIQLSLSNNTNNNNYPKTQFILWLRNILGVNDCDVMLNNPYKNT